MGASLAKNLGNRSTRGNRRRRAARSGALMSEINVTPFVDVMLVLLIIFMVTAPLLTAGVQVDLPEADSAPLQGQDEPLEVSIAKNGDVFIQDKKIKLSDLVAKLDAITKRKKDTRIFVRGDKAADYGKVITVISTINGAGFTKVGLVTEANSTTSIKKSSEKSK